MVDQLLYRLNRVPDRLYVHVPRPDRASRCFPPAAASADVTFWLSAPQAADGGRAGRHRGGDRPRTETRRGRGLHHRRPTWRSSPCALRRVATSGRGRRPADRTDGAARPGGRSPCFQPPPAVGRRAAARPDRRRRRPARCRCGSTAASTASASTRGDPPLVWEAWTGDDWAACERRPRRHRRAQPGRRRRAARAGRHTPRRCSARRAGRLAAVPGASARSRAAVLHAPRRRCGRRRRFTIGGTVAAVHAETVATRCSALSEGVPGPAVPAARRAGGRRRRRRWCWRCPAATAGRTGSEVDVASPGPAPTTGTSCSTAAAGEVAFGPAVREPDGSLRQYGAVPPKGAPICGSAATAPAAAGAATSPAARCRVLRAPVPFVGRGRRTGEAGRRRGGRRDDREAPRRAGRCVLRTRDRAVTARGLRGAGRRRRPAGGPGPLRAGRPEHGRGRRGTGAGGAGGGAPTRTAGCASSSCVPRRRDAGADRAVPRRPPADRHPGGRRAAALPGRHRGGPADRARPGTAPRRSGADALDALYRYLNPLDRRAGRQRLAVRPAGAGRRGLRACCSASPACELVEDVGSSRPTRSPGQRGEADPADRARRRTRWSSPTSTRSGSQG